MTRERIEVKQGEAVFKEGEHGDCMYVIAEGQVQIIKEGPKEPVVLATLHPGSFFGEMAIVDCTERTATALAATDVTVMPVRSSELVTMMQHRPELGAKMIRTLVRRLIYTTNQVVDEKEKLVMLFSQEPEA